MPESGQSFVPEEEIKSHDENEKLLEKIYKEIEEKKFDFNSLLKYQLIYITQSPLN